MSTKNVAINGFGRIGRAFFKVARNNPDIQIVAINDLGDIDNLAYLLKYDTVYPDHKLSVETREGELIVEGVPIKFISQPEPEKLPWGDLSIDVVVESTGVFTRYETAQAHITAGAKRVVISAPAKDADNEGSLGRTILMGVNEDELSTCNISSNGSCTTNAGSPLIAILDEKIGIEKALLNTVHGYTASQALVDAPNKKDYRKGRAAAQNIVPTSTGAAIAVTKALPTLENKFDGIAMRVPVVAGSVADITFIAKRETSVLEVNDILKAAANEKRWEGVYTATEDPLVSSDILGEPYASIADLSMTRVVDGTLVKVLGWYDNEIGYAHTLVKHVVKAALL